jgi:ABC-type multidrug transport system ATPase subunit/pSer/pThr/pTyr-binding forkhead associated (FHA) protein
LDFEISILAGLPPRTQTIQSPSVVIGRAVEADFVVNHPEVSRRHCRILQEGPAWFIEDLGSRRGTMVNGTRITARTPIHEGDEILLGPVSLGFGLASGSVALGPPPGAVLFQQKPATLIPLGKPLVFGRSAEADIQLCDPMVSRRHAIVEPDANGYRLLDLHSKSGSFVNGRRFIEHNLVIGDQIHLGPFHFVFNGVELLRLRRLSVGRIVARDLEKRAGSRVILQKVSFVVEPGQFVGILGPSGAGKSTLLDAMSGLRPAEGGQILVDEADLYAHINQLRSMFGYVPQDDIVHPELTVVDALTFAARLRLPRGTPIREVRTLVNHTITNLGLSDRSQLRVAQLSGGQRKRVSVGVELLSRPPILFLDEPTSGLDPFAEFKLMELLRRLADTGCTVVCATHIMENVYLMDQIAILLQGRLIFQGTPDAARAAFGVSRLNGLYEALQSIDPEKLPALEPPPASIEAEKPAEASFIAAKRRRAFFLPILLQRQAAIFCADLKNFIVLFGQPIVIGALVSWATTDPSLAQFFACVATLWFGCSNSAQEIVREMPVYRREHLAGLRRASYILSKVLWLGALTASQSVLLYLTIAIGERRLPGFAGYQILGLLLLSFAATGIGLTISAFARSAIQAVMLVPLVLIPQILFSGFTPPATDMSAPVLAVSQIMPSFAAQRISDVSFLLNQKISGDLVRDFLIPYNNLNDWYRRQTGERLKSGMIFTETKPLWVGLFSLVLWTITGFGASYLLLARRE